MQNNDPTSRPPATATPAGTPLPPPTQPDPMTVLNPGPSGALTDPDQTDTSKIAMIVLAVLLVIAVGIAAWQFVPWPKPDTPRPAATINTVKVEAALVQVDAAFDDLDSNMAGVDPALSDVQGSLNE